MDYSFDLNYSRFKHGVVGRALLTAGVVGLLGGSIAPVPVGAAVTTPSQPGSGYVLDWEAATTRTMPAAPPPAWAAEYSPTLRHTDGEPQLRAASSAHEPVRAGQWSARFELDKGDPTINNGARAELSTDFEPLGAERWYGFSVYLPPSWVPDRSAESVIQWHQHWDLCCSPPLAILTRNGQWEISQNWEGPTNQDTPIGAYQTNRWTDWVVHVKWSSSNDGVLEIWKDGTPVPGFAHKIGKNTYASTAGNYLKIGIYKWDWSQGKPSDTSRRVMYLDELRIADQHGSYATVAPPSAVGSISVATPLALSPATPTAGQQVTAGFTVRNSSDRTVSIPYFLVGARDPSNRNVDFPASPAVTLQPGQTYAYTGTRTVSAAGSYSAWPAYYDGRDWIELGVHKTFSVQTPPVACSPTFPQLGSGTFPAGCWRPYSDSSPFNTPLPEQLQPSQLMANSPAIVQHILNTAQNKQPSNLVANVDGTSGWPTYYSHFARTTDPAYRLHCTRTWGTCPLEGTTVHIPEGAVVQGGQAAATGSPSDPDAHLTVVDVDSGWEYDLWQVQRSPIRSRDGAQLNISWGGRARIDGNGLAADDNGQGTAAGFGDLAGRIRAEEFLGGAINHALFIVIDCDNGSFVYPARAHDKLCSTDLANAPPMGARLQLAMTRAEIDALPVPEWKKILLRAMATYGMIFGDTGSSFAFTFQTEAGVQYTVSQQSDRWLEVAKKYGWAYFGGDPSYPSAAYTGSMQNRDDGLDWNAQVWSRLRVVAPCVSMETCP